MSPEIVRLQQIFAGLTKILNSNHLNVLRPICSTLCFVWQRPQRLNTEIFFALLPTVFMFNAAINESKNVKVQLLLKVPSFIYIHLTKFSINFLTIQFRFTQHCLDTLMQDKETKIDQHFENYGVSDNMFGYSWIVGSENLL